MSGNGDEPDSVYGLLARAVSVSPDKLGYRFLLRPEARFADGSKVTAADVKFSLDVLKEKAHPTYSQLLIEIDGVDAEADDVALVRFVKERSRDAHLIVAGMPIFSAAWWKGRDFDASTLEAPLGSGAYQGQDVRAGALHRIRAATTTIGPRTCRSTSARTISPAALRILSRAAGRVRGVQGRRDQLPSRNTPSRIWATGYDFPAVKRRPRQEGDAAQRRADRLAGLVLQHRAANSSRTRACARRSASASISNGPTRT